MSQIKWDSLLAGTGGRSGSGRSSGGGVSTPTSPTPPTTTTLPGGFSVRTPGLSPTQKLNQRYNTIYVPQLRQAGTFNENFAKQMYAFDKQRLSQGKGALSTLAWLNAYHSLRKGHSLVQQKNVSGGSSGGGFSVGGFFSDLYHGAVSDIATVAGGINPLRAIPAIDKEVFDTLHTPEALASGEVKVHNLSDVLGLPGIRDIPGAFTAKNIVSGDWHNINNHPIMTILDILPYTHAISHALALTQLGKVAEASAETVNYLDAVKKLQLAKNAVENAAVAGHAKKTKGFIWTVGPNGDAIRMSKPEFDLQMAQDAVKHTKAAWDEMNKHPETAIKPGSAEEAMYEGKLFKAAARKIPVTPTGRTASAITHDILLKRGLSGEFAEIARFQAMKLNGEALSTVEGKTRWADYKEKEAILKDITDHFQTIVPKKHGRYQLTPMQDKIIKNAQNSLIEARGKLVTAVNKEMTVQSSIAFGKPISDVLPNGYYLRHDPGKAGNHGKIIGPNGKPVTGGARNRLLKELEKNGYKTGRDIARAMGMTEGAVRKLEKELGNIKLLNIAVPQWVYHAYWQMNHEPTALVKDLTKVSDVYRYSVIMRPQHIIHVQVFNAIMTMLGDPGAFLEWRGAADMTREQKWPEGMGTQVAFTSPESHADNFVAIGTGKKLHDILRGSLAGRLGGGYMHATRHIEETTNNFYRSMHYISGYGKGISDYQLSRLAPQYERWGATITDPRHLAGLESVRKFSLSWDSMTPVERSAFRIVFPFYPYTRKLAEFALQFPHDHPLRAALIAQIGKLEMQDWGTGIPSKFMDFFPIGAMDKNGNQLMLDGKSFNPFRGLNGYNPMTTAGFLSSLNPGFQLVAIMAGGDILSATPQINPTLQVDPKTGAFVTASSPGNVLTQLVETYLPPAQAIDAYFGLSQQYKGLKQNGGSAAQWKAVVAAMGLTFGYPQNINIMQEKIKFAEKQFTVATNQEKEAMRTGKVPSANPSTVYPVRGQFKTGKELQQLLDAAKKVRKQEGTNDPLSSYIGN